MRGWGLFFFLLFLVVILAYAAYIGFTQFRARRAGLPAPSWKSYIPFLSSSSTSSSYGNFPTPRRGGVVGWFKDTIASMRNRRTAHGAYEERLEGERRGDVDGGAWDARVGNETYYEEQELGLAPPVSAGGAYAGGGYGAPERDTEAGLGPESYTHTEERGRSRSRERDVPPPYDTTTATPGSNPFGDEAERSELRAVSPRPAADNRKSHDDPERRSIFREGL